jgi:hypothetical protein
VTQQHHGLVRIVWIIDAKSQYAGAYRSAGKSLYWYFRFLLLIDRRRPVSLGRQLPTRLVTIAYLPTAVTRYVDLPNMKKTARSQGAHKYLS